MRKILLILTLFVSFIASAQIEKVLPPKPNPPKLVNDFTGTLTREQITALENKLVTYDDSTSNQIAVVIVPTTGDYSVEEVGLEIIRRWGVGGKEHSNGIVLLIAKEDRKLRIEVGYGLEGAVPDITAKSIIDNDLTPNFKAGNYYRGIDLAIDDIIKAAAGEYKAPAGYGKKKKPGVGLGSLIFLIILFFIIFGGMGGRGGGMVSRRGYGGFPAGWIIGNILGGLSSGRSGGGGWS